MTTIAEKTSTSGIIRRRGQRLFWAVGLLGLFLLGIALAVWQILQYQDSIESQNILIQGTEEVGAITFAAKGLPQTAPIAIIAHGFSGDKEMMQALAVEMSKRLPVRAIVFDFGGHGVSPTRFVPPNADRESIYQRNRQTLSVVYNYARQTYPEAKIVLAGHSMGSGVVGRFATETPDVAATVLISPAGIPQFTETNPQNLLILVGENDIPGSIEGAKQALNLSTGGKAPADFSRSGEVFGEFEAGTARQLYLAKGENHITIIYVAQTAAMMGGWLESSLWGKDGSAVRAAILDDQNGAGFRLRWMIVGLIFCICLIYPASSLLIDAFKLRYVPTTRTPRVSGKRNLVAMSLLLGGEVVAMLLWTGLKPPTLAGSYLGSWMAGFFLITGIIAWTGLWFRDVRNPKLGTARFSDFCQNFKSVITTKFLAWVIIPLGLFVIFYESFGLFSSFTWLNLQFNGIRLLSMMVMVICLLPFFLADEFIFRRITNWRGYFLGLISKLGLMAVLFGAILLNPSLGFLSILIPMMALLFIVFGFFSLWLFWLGNDFVISGVLQALLLSWIISGFFPIAA
jgi:pimeloyl-ACP methyl ester carboxylesterase